MRRTLIKSMHLQLEDGHGMVVKSEATADGIWLVEYDEAKDNPFRDGGGILVWQDFEIRWKTQPEKRQEST